MRFRPRTATIVVAAAGASSLALACSALLSLEPPPPPRDGGGPGACTTWYVAGATGDDANDGCSIDKPLKSIKAALAAAETTGTPDFVIKVCEGTYKEDALQISLPGTLQGSWDCAFTRQVNASAVNGTTLEVANTNIVNAGSQRVETLHFSPKVLAAGTASVTATVDHFKIVGATDKGSLAVHVANSQPVKIDSCAILGADTDGSVGLYLTVAAAEVSHNVILGGSAAGAYAVQIIGDTLLQPTGPHLHDNTITAGGAATGTGTGIGSVAVKIDGVSLTGDAGAPFEHNVVTTQGIVGTSDAGAAGVTISNASVDVVENVIRASGAITDGESSTQTGGSCGITVFNGSAVRILGNRIYAAGRPGFGDWTGIFLSATKSALVENNVIYAGQPAPETTQVGGAYGILLTNVAGAVILSNTIYSGYPAGNAKRAFGISTGSNVTNATIENNVLAGAGTTDWGIHIATCPAGVSVLRNNLFVGQAFGTVDNPCDAGPPAARDVAGITAIVPSATQNLAMRDSPHCSAADLDSGACVVDSRCTATPACLAALFADWGTDGLGAFDAGMRLDPSTSCRIGLGGADLRADPDHPVTTDIFGAPRGATPSIGASEILDGGCR